MNTRTIKMRKCVKTGVYYAQSNFYVFDFPTIGHKIISKYNKYLWDEADECTREEQRSINEFVKKRWDETNERS